MSSPDRPTPYQYEPTLEVPGADIHLRLASLNDIDELVAVCREADGTLVQFVPSVLEWNTPEGARAFLQVAEERMREGSLMRYFTVEGQPEEGGQLFGGVALRHHTPGERTAMLGMWVDAPHQGRGLTGPAAAAVMQYAAKEEVWDLRTVYAKASPDNRPSERVLKNIGFDLVTKEPFSDPEGINQVGGPQMVKTWRKRL